MKTFSALLAICAGNSPISGLSPQKGQWRRALMFSLICARINNWVKNREAGDLRCRRAHYDDSVMSIIAIAVGEGAIKIQELRYNKKIPQGHGDIDYV